MKRFLTKWVWAQNRFKMVDGTNPARPRRKSNISIISGGIALFDSILYKKKIICIPQYKHQELNAKKIFKTKAINYLNIKNKNFHARLVDLILKIYKDEHYLKKINAIQGRIIDIKKVKNTLELFLKTYAKSKKLTIFLTSKKR